VGSLFAFTLLGAAALFWVTLVYRINETFIDFLMQVGRPSSAERQEDEPEDESPGHPHAVFYR
jgi:hypothetical protein